MAQQEELEMALALAPEYKYNEDEILFEFFENMMGYLCDKYYLQDYEDIDENEHTTTVGYKNEDGNLYIVYDTYSNPSHVYNIIYITVSTIKNMGFDNSEETRIFEFVYENTPDAKLFKLPENVEGDYEDGEIKTYVDLTTYLEKIKATIETGIKYLDKSLYVLK